MRVGVEKQKNMENKFHGSTTLNPNVSVDIISWNLGDVTLKPKNYPKNLT